ncbi:MAG TPA: hypothetical protein VK338_00905 [Candidatus Nitrosocosmicus sp.]|nr:hypothetical protein [Candidatus Nitrosocosmicus sp.]
MLYTSIYTMRTEEEQRNYQAIMGDRIVDRDLTDPTKGRLFNVYLSANVQENPGHNPPEHSYHIEQVYLVGFNMLRTMNEVTQNDFDALTEKAYGHDMGRAWSKGLGHLTFGKQALEILDADKNLADYAVEHHKWGLIAYEEDVIKEVQEVLPSNKKLDDILDGFYDDSLKFVFKEIYDQMLEKYGISGLVILVADNSKDYTDPSSKYMTNISAFDKRLAKKLIETQLNRNRYLPDSIDHLIEVIGTRYTHYILKRLTKDYGLNYKSAIESAKQEWPAYKQKVDEAWETALQLQCEVYSLQ